MSAQGSVGERHLLQRAALIVLTAIYLCFELAFNARLLDVVGTAASAEDIHNIEVSGRLLSGVAVALVVLQVLLLVRKPLSAGTILLTCAATVIVVFFAIRALVDQVVEGQSTEFRRTATNIVLVQRALVTGDARLAALVSDETTFASPEGKSFLALFPLLAMSVDRLDDKIRASKLAVLRALIERETGGAGALYERYREAVDRVRSSYETYAAAPEKMEAAIAQEQERAWQSYLNDLARRGWTPSTVPFYARGTVRRNVQKQVAVPAGWAPSDERTFRNAVAAKARSKLVAADGSIFVGKHRFRPGLGYMEFIGSRAIQAELRKALGLPAGLTVSERYATANEFRRKMYDPWLESRARSELKNYEAPVEAFEYGGSLYATGTDAARAVLVPPIALLFSLVGALGHLGKLLFLMFGFLATIASSKWAPRLRLAGALALLVVMFGGWSALSSIDNNITRSELYLQLTKSLRDRSQGQSLWVRVKARATENVLHVVGVGQGYGYPINEWIRVKVLNGLTYGYRS